MTRKYEKGERERERGRERGREGESKTRRGREGNWVASTSESGGRGHPQELERLVVEEICLVAVSDQLIVVQNRHLRTKQKTER